MEKVGVIVMDQSLARLFMRNSPKEALALIASLENPKGRLHDREMREGRPGRVFDSAGKGRHSMQKHFSPKEQQGIRFACLVGEWLEKHMRAGLFQRLVLCAPPKQLGIIRGALPEKVKATLIASIGKDFSALEEGDIRSHLVGELPMLFQESG